MLLVLFCFVCVFHLKLILKSDLYSRLPLQTVICQVHASLWNIHLTLLINNCTNKQTNSAVFLPYKTFAYIIYAAAELPALSITLTQFCHFVLHLLAGILCLKLPGSYGAPFDSHQYPSNYTF